ncbi:MAG: hypothetical protein EHM20_15605 [Alphaproteobacteria bacterium]|nr:MAG: hypothetical protein EHM20_15605 [Alphaproteobacteria bacterium]
MSTSESKELRCLDILHGIKNGSIDATVLLPEQRKLLVSFLMAEGQSNAEIAHLLKVSDRTIERDKKIIRKENAITQDPELAGIIAGRLFDEAQVCIQRIRKFQRDSDCPPAAKIEGEKGCFQIVNSLAERLQSMGYLPIAANKFQAELTHNIGNTLSLDEINSEVKRLQNIKSLLPDKRTKEVESKIVKE